MVKQMESERTTARHVQLGEIWGGKGGIKLASLLLSVVIFTERECIVWNSGRSKLAIVIAV